MEDLWFTRSGHRNGWQFEDVTLRSVKFDSYAIHGNFFNSCWAEDCISLGAGQQVGAAFHAYRNTAAFGTDKGNIYIRCHAENSAWGWYSHGSGNNIPPNRFVRLEYCTGINLILPTDLNTAEGFKIYNSKFQNVPLRAGPYGYYENCTWDISTADPLNTGIFYFAESSTLRNCNIQGGLDRNRIVHSIYAPITLIQTTVSVRNQQIFVLNSGFHFTNSIWNVAGGINVLSAVDTYLPFVVLDSLGRDTIENVVNIYSPLRKINAKLYPDSLYYVYDPTLWTPATNIVLTAGSDRIQINRSGGDVKLLPLGGWEIDINGTPYRANAISVVNTTTYVMDAPAPATATLNSSTFVKFRRADISYADKQSVQGLKMRMDANAATRNYGTLAGNDIQKRKVIDNEYLKLYYNNGYENKYFGIFKVDSLALPSGRVKLDATPDWFQYYHPNSNWIFKAADQEQSTSGGDWMEHQNTLNIDITFPDVAFSHLSFRLINPRATSTWLSDRYGRIYTDTNGDIRIIHRLEYGTPGQGFRFAVPARTEDQPSDAWTLQAETFMKDFVPVFEQVGNQILLSEESYIYKYKIGYQPK